MSEKYTFFHLIKRFFSSFSWFDNEFLVSGSRVCFLCFRNVFNLIELCDANVTSANFEVF